MNNKRKVMSSNKTNKKLKYETDNGDDIPLSNLKKNLKEDYNVVVETNNDSKINNLIDLNDEVNNDKLILISHPVKRTITCFRCNEEILLSQSHICKDIIKYKSLHITHCSNITENDRDECEDCLKHLEKIEYVDKHWYTDPYGYVRCTKCKEKCTLNSTHVGCYCQICEKFLDECEYSGDELDKNNSFKVKIYLENKIQ